VVEALLEVVRGPRGEQAGPGWPDLVIVLAGKEEPMREYLRSVTPELEGRFPLAEALLFEDLTPESLKELVIARVAREVGSLGRWGCTAFVWLPTVGLS
jgi:hypothetical protein